MKKTLLLIPFIIFIGCEDKEDEKEVSRFVGTWKITFGGEYENSDCTGAIDSTDWEFMEAFGFAGTLTVNEGGTYEMTISIFGLTEIETGTWVENENSQLIIDDEILAFTMTADGNSFVLIEEMEAYCEDSYTYEETAHSDSTSCTDAGNYWYEESCGLTEFTKQ
ncbi:MAG: hypothetical protein H8E70_01030 [Candidatus Marinimicrobia bacterium]|nr:hypothetical protein [Candidatus Neomarinimicrobiota bacterium]